MGENISRALRSNTDEVRALKATIKEKDATIKQKDAIIEVKIGVIEDQEIRIRDQEIRIRELKDLLKKASVAVQSSAALAESTDFTVSTIEAALPHATESSPPPSGCLSVSRAPYHKYYKSQV